MSDTPMNPNAKRAGDLPDRIMEMHAAAMREMGEPRDGVSPTPVTYLILCFFFVMWGGYYIGRYGGDWTANGLSENPAGAAATAPAPPADPMVLGKEIFNACTQCHQADGKGVEGSFPPLVPSEYVTGDERRLAAILLNGITGEFVVNGKTYNSQMPAWKDTYNDEELAAVMTYIRNSFGNKAAPVGKAVVEAARKEVGGQDASWNAATLAAFAATKPAAASPAPTTTAPASAPTTTAPAPAPTK